jgi:hypothetical protein
MHQGCLSNFRQLFCGKVQDNHNTPNHIKTLPYRSYTIYWNYERIKNTYVSDKADLVYQIQGKRDLELNKRLFVKNLPRKIMKFDARLIQMPPGVVPPQNTLVITIINKISIKPLKRNLTIGAGQAFGGIGPANMPSYHVFLIRWHFNLHPSKDICIVSYFTHIRMGSNHNKAPTVSNKSRQEV